jgi:hypothetical protein
MDKHQRTRLMQWLVRKLADVTGFQIMYYAWFFAAGFYGLAIADSQPPLTLMGTMPHLSVQAWYWFNIIGPAAGATGIWMERTKYNYEGLCIEVFGNVLFAGSLLAYILATLQVESWGRGMYGAVPLAASSLTSTSCLVLRDTLRILLRRRDE